MKRDQARYGESFPLKTHELQYEMPIAWLERFSAESVLKSSRVAFIESSDNLSNKPGFRAVARKDWWTVLGRARIVKEDRQEFEQRLANTPQAENYWLSERVNTSQAKYKVSVIDISTLEDRSHWVARAKISLSDRKTGEVFAEYTGFAANQAPAYGPKGAWEQQRVCPGKEQSYVERHISWDVVGFFFREVVVYYGV